MSHNAKNNPLPIAEGGTAAVTAGAALTALGGTAAGTAVFTAADAAAQRTSLGVVVGTDVQAYDADLSAIAALTSAADKMPYATGAQTWALADLTAAGRAIMASSIGTVVSAWVKFNGTGTPAINSAYNVASITDHGTGQYTAVFTSALPNADYAVTGVTGDAAASVGAIMPAAVGTPAWATTGFRFYTYSQPTNLATDFYNVSVAFFST